MPRLRMRTVRALLLAALATPLVALTADAAHAQHAPRRTTAALDIALAFGAGHGGVFADESLFGARAALSLRRELTRRTAVFAEAFVDATASIIDQGLNCILPLDGGPCIDNFPLAAGPGITVGVMRTSADRRYETRAGVGAAAFWVEGNDGRPDVIGSHLGAAVFHVDGAVAPGSPDGAAMFVFGIRHAILGAPYRGDDLAMTTLTFGLRVRAR